MILNYLQPLAFHPVDRPTANGGNSLSQMSAQLDGADAGPRSSNKSVCHSFLDALDGCRLFDSGVLSNVDFRSSPFKRNFVHGKFHQIDAPPVFG